MPKHRTKEQWQRLEVWCLMVSGGGIGMAFGAVLALGLLHVCRPGSVANLCGLVGFVVWIGGIATGFISGKQAQWSSEEEAQQISPMQHTRRADVRASTRR
jgi:hypothetical protein